MNNFFIRAGAYAHGIWIHRWSVLSIIGLTTLCGWLAIGSLPESYRAHMSVYVEYNVASTDATHRNLKRFLLNRKNLESILVKSGYTKRDKPLTGHHIKQLRHNLAFKSDRTLKTFIPYETLDITYTADSPENAFKILNTITNILSGKIFAASMNVRVLEYPQLPILPYQPNHSLLRSISSLAAIVSGLVWGIGRYRFSSVISDYRQLRKKIKHPVLGVVDLHKNPETRKHQRLNMLLFVLACTGMLLVMLLAITHR